MGARLGFAVAASQFVGGNCSKVILFSKSCPTENSACSVCFAPAGLVPVGQRVFAR